ncbi:uncharacterized protein LOC6054364 isoform X1 [Culex quinquefasciatus]|uniref:uncharacterized protein LOC6054364 isoform X1 n=1 Tax=Culex quinquefasciatus TaxID=7176 RepID=UPI0018E3F974|nr:uncharacterized protein LOC6054364 isoform X1 [Culex quinquefasciatus]
MTTGSIIKNHSKIPNALCVAVRYWIERYFKTLNGFGLCFSCHNLDFLSNYDIEFNSVINLLVMALVLTETSFEELLSSSYCDSLGLLKDLEIFGLNLVQEQKDLLKSVRNLDISTIDTFKCEDLQRSYLLCLEHAKGPNYYTLETILGYTFAENSIMLDKLGKFSDTFTSKDFKLSIALGLNNFSEALTLCPQDIISFDERMFAWNDLIDALVDSGVDPTNWNLETFSFVVEKLVRYGNSGSLERLCCFRAVPDIITKAISTGDDSLVLKVFGDGPQKVDDGSLKDAIKFHLNDSVLSILDKLNENQLEFILLESIRLKNDRLFEAIIKIKPTCLPKAFEAAVYHNRIRIVRKLLHSSIDSSVVSRALYSAMQHKRWKIAKFLLNNSQADPTIRFHPEYLEFEIPIETAFQGTVAAGKLGLLRMCPIDAELNWDLSLITLAASTVSVDLIRCLVKLGFNVAFEPEVIPCIIAIGYTKIWKDTIASLELRPWDGPNADLTNLYFQIEQWKVLMHLEKIFYCEVFQQSANFKLMSSVARRIKLYKTFQEELVIKKVDSQIGLFSNIQQYLKQQNQTIIQKHKTFHFFGSLEQQYAFCDLKFYITSDIDDENLCEEIESLEETNITSSLIIDKISELFNLSEKRCLLIFNINIFREDILCSRSINFLLGSTFFTVEVHPQKTVPFFNVQNLEQKVRGLLDVIANETPFQLAINSGDVPSLAHLLRGKKAEEFVGLNFDLFHKIVDFKGKEQKSMAVMLLEVGLKSWTLNPNWVCSILNYAMSKDCLELAQLILSYDCFGRTTDEEFEKVINYGSIEIYEMFLSMVPYNEVEIFKNVSNALQSLSCKEVEIGEELQTYLQYQLADFGFKHLCADPKTPKNYGEWLKSIEFIVEWTNQLSTREDSNSYLGIDNEVLFRLRMIHNQLYLIKDNVQLRKIPIMEVTILLAVFLKIFKEKEFDMYRMVINKPLLIKFLTSISNNLNAFQDEFKRVTSAMNSIMTSLKSRARQNLEPVWTSDSSMPTLSDNIWNRLSSKKFKDVPFSAIIGEVFCTDFIDFTYPNKSRKTFAKIKEIFFRVKQMYSLYKIAKSLDFSQSLILSHKQTAEILQDQSGRKEGYVAVIKRFTQIFGECIKATTNTPNIPKKIGRILETMLWSEVEQNKTTRDVTCHKFPLIKTFFTARDLFLYYTNTPKYMSNVGIAVKILIVFTCFEYFRWYFDSLLRISSLKTLRDFICFVGDQKVLIKLQTKLFADVKNFHEANESAIDVKLRGNCTVEIRDLLQRTKTNYSKRIAVLSCLERMKISNFFYDFDVFQAVAYASDSIQICHRMIEMNFAKSRISNDSFFQLLTDNWKILRYEAGWLVSEQMIDLDMISMGSAQRIFDIDNKLVQEYYCREEVEQICDFLLEESEVLLQEKSKLEAALFLKLNKIYFKDIFLIDSKYDAIDKVMPKKNVPNLVKKIKEMRKKDQKELKQLTQNFQNFIKQLLRKHNCETIHKLTRNFKNIPTESVLAIEFWMLELSEILVSTKHFQDNFHTIKGDVQMICGRNFRNYLAHDGISYDLLTNSSRVKVLVNALVMAEIDWQLFGDREKFDLPDVEDVKVEGLSHVRTQESLKGSLLGQDEAGIECSLSRGGLLSAKYWMNLNSELQQLRLPDLWHYINDAMKPRHKVSLILKNFNQENNCFSNIKLLNAIRKDQFEHALATSGEDSWSSFFESSKLSVSVWRFMGRLIKYLSQQDDISEILDLLNDFGSKFETILMLIGSHELRNIILTVNPSKLKHSEVHAIVRSNSLKDLQNIDFLFNSSETMTADLVTLLQNTVSCSNLFAFKFMIENFKFNTREDAEETFLYCVISGRTKMVQTLMESNFGKVFNLERALQVAASHRKWTLVKYFLSRGANLIQIDDLRKIGRTVFGCLKYFKQFPIDLPEGYHLHVELPNVSKFSLADFELLLKSGYNILRYQPFFRYVMKSDDEGVLALVEKHIFNYKTATLYDSNLSEWQRNVHECKILNYLTIDLLGLCLKNKVDFFYRIVERIKTFGITDSGFGVEIVNEFDYEVNATKALDLCIDVQKSLSISNQINIFSQFEREFLYMDSEDNLKQITVQFKIYGAKELPKVDQFDQFAFCENNLTFNRIYRDIIQIAEDLNILKTCHITTVDFDYANKSYRFLNILSNQILLRFSPNFSPIKKILNTQDRSGSTIMSGVPNSKIFTLLIDCGADLSIENNDGESALFAYTQWPWSELEPVFKYCVESGICNSKGTHLFHAQSNRNISVLAVAASNGAAEAVQFLVTYGADHTAYDCGGMFPLYMAVHMQRINVVEVLLNHSHETVNKKCQNIELTSIFQAVCRNNAILVKMLLGCGADLSFEYNGLTIFGVAIQHQANRALKVLLEYAKRNKLEVVTDYKENTSPIQFALLADDVEMFEIVLESESGGSFECLDSAALAKMKNLLNEPQSDGFSLYALAKSTGNLKIVAFMEKCAELGERFSGEKIELEHRINFASTMKWFNDYVLSGRSSNS